MFNAFNRAWRRSGFGGSALSAESVLAEHITTEPAPVELTTFPERAAERAIERAIAVAERAAAAHAAAKPVVVEPEAAAKPGGDSMGDNNSGHSSFADEELHEWAELYPSNDNRYNRYCDVDDDNYNNAMPFGPFPGGAADDSSEEHERQRFKPRGNASGRRAGSLNRQWTALGTMRADESNFLKRARTFGGDDWRHEYGCKNAIRRVYMCISHLDCGAKLSFSPAGDESQWNVEY